MTAFGHHIIAVLAFDLLNETEQNELLKILTAHPRYDEDFSPPDKIRNVNRWRIGRAGYWPDVARKQPKYNRPKWHYQLASTLTIGNKASVNIPDTPGPCPDSANLDTKELHIAQAFVLCQRVMSDHSQQISDRAIALTWIAHLVGDAHQPCHAGSLYVVDVFPEGDRGANSIAVVQGNNLHALWDGLLGKRYDEGDVERRLKKISDNSMAVGQEAMNRPATLDPLTWLSESREHAVALVYTSEVLGPVNAAHEGLVDAVPKIDLTDEYLKRAGAFARVRAAEAAIRLAKIWRRTL